MFIYDFFLVSEWKSLNGIYTIASKVKKYLQNMQLALFACIIT